MSSEYCVIKSFEYITIILVLLYFNIVHHDIFASMSQVEIRKYLLLAYYHYELYYKQ